MLLLGGGGGQYLHFSHFFCAVGDRIPPPIPSRLVLPSPGAQFKCHTDLCVIQNAEDVIDRKPFVFLVRTLLRTRIVQPPNQPFQARPSPRAMQTPTKALSPFQSSRVCAMPNKAPEHATVMWLAVAPGLTVSMNPASSSYTITNLKMIRGFQVRRAGECVCERVRVPAALHNHHRHDHTHRHCCCCSCCC